MSFGRLFFFSAVALTGFGSFACILPSFASGHSHNHSHLAPSEASSDEAGPSGSGSLPSSTIVQSSGVLRVFLPPVPDSASWCGEWVDLKGNPYLRERYDREILNVTYSHSSTLQLLKRSGRYFPVIEQILRDENMPDDLKYLAVAESSLNPRALSGAKAAGLWQMVPDAGKEHGLQVDADVDERYNIELETRAACRYLRRSYEVLGNWAMAAASYNTGRGRVTRQRKIQMADSFYEMNLMEETNRYVFRILALKALMECPEDYGYVLSGNDFYSPVPVDTLGVDSAIVNLAAFSRLHNINYNLLKEENPWLRSNALPNPSGKHFVIRVPLLNR